jgi:hypothetical protein
MNMPINKSILDDALAMANIPMTLAECYDQINGVKPMSRLVLQVVESLNMGSVIRPAHDQPLRKIKRKQETQPRAKGINVEDRKNIIVALLKDTHMKVDEMASDLNMRVATIQSWLTRLELDGVIQRQNLCGRAVLWFLPDYTHPFITEYKESHERREVAMRLQKPYYEAFKCVRCGLTKRMTVRNRCLGCTQGQSLDYYYSIKTD